MRAAFLTRKDYDEVKVERKWSMPNKETFSMGATWSTGLRRLKGFRLRRYKYGKTDSVQHGLHGSHAGDA